jgi:hypothetical protein
LETTISAGVALTVETVTALAVSAVTVVVVVGT